MPTVTLEALRWRDPPAQATVAADGASVHLQVTAPREVEAMGVGRPVEELPRILSILSPAHHLCAARLLDRLFGVEPPPAAAAAREALRLALVLRHHLRAFWFLASAAEDPFTGFWPEGARRGVRSLRPVLADLARHVALAREAAAVLGGRADHPVTSVAGGVTRALRPEHAARLAEIAAACLGCAERLGDFLRPHLVADGPLLGEVRTLDPGPMASLASSGPEEVTLRGVGGGPERFAAGAVLDRIALRREPWSHEPFAYLAARGWRGLDGGAPPEGAFLVGPLARLGGGEPLATPRAEAERQRLVAALGPPPRLEVAAAYWAMLVEVLGAAEALAAAADPERLVGAAVRAIPSGRGAEAHAALESPRGLVFQQVRADERGLVTELRVLDAATANNALHGVVALRAVERSRAQGHGWAEAKRRIELALLPY